ncbi:MAG: hypothetical protein LBK07_07785 [Tannerella sp.]|nr:hypothetical protein [Tannerella sp.]
MIDRVEKTVLNYKSLIINGRTEHFARRNLSGLLRRSSTQGRCGGGCIFFLQRVESTTVKDKIEVLFTGMNVRINHVSHTVYFITARISTISIAPPGFARLHKAIFDSFFGGTYGVSSFPALAFLSVAGLDVAFLGVVALDAFAVMTVQFYYLWMQRYNFREDSQNKGTARDASTFLSAGVDDRLHAAWFCTFRADAAWHPTWIIPCKPQAQFGVETAHCCLNCVAVQLLRSRDAMHRVSTTSPRFAVVPVARQRLQPSSGKFNSRFKIQTASRLRIPPLPCGEGPGER